MSGRGVIICVLEGFFNLSPMNRKLNQSSVKESLLKLALSSCQSVVSNNQLVEAHDNEPKTDIVGNSVSLLLGPCWVSFTQTNSTLALDCSLLGNLREQRGNEKKSELDTHRFGNDELNRSMKQSRQYELLPVHQSNQRNHMQNHNHITSSRANCPTAGCVEPVHYFRVRTLSG